MEKIEDYPKKLRELIDLVFKGQEKDLFYLGIASFLINSLALTLPIVLMQIYDRIIAKSSVNTLYILLTGAAFAIVLETILKIAKDALANCVGEKFDDEISTNLLRKILFSKDRIHQQQNIGYLMEGVSSVGKLKKAATGRIVTALLDIPFIFLFILIIGSINYSIAIFLLLVFASYMAFAIYHKNRFMELKLARQKQRDIKTSFLVGILSRVYQLKALGLERRTIRKNDYIEKVNSFGSLKEKIMNDIPDAVSIFYSQLVLFGILGIGAYHVINGNMTVGVLTACTLMGNRFFQPINGVVRLYLNLTDDFLAFEKVKELEAMETLSNLEKEEEKENLIGKISFRGLCILDDKENKSPQINLDLSSREFISIVDTEKNFSSKLVNFLLGRLIPQEGEVFIDDEIISNINIENLNNNLAYVPQSGVLFNGTVLENITMFNEDYVQSAFDCANIVGLNNLIAELPKGFDTFLTSKNQYIVPVNINRRIMIARALVRRPKIVIFDRIHHSMDLETLKMFNWLVERLKGKMTIVLVTRDEQYDYLADQTINFNSNYFGELNTGVDHE